MTIVYALFTKDPYEEHDRPLLDSVYSTREQAEAARMDKFSYTFGKDAAYTKNSPFSNFMIDEYYDIEEFQVIEDYQTPEWITSALERREKEKEDLKRRTTKK